MMLFTATTLLVACDNQNLTVLDSTASTTVSLSASDVILSLNDTGKDVLTVNWTEPNFGFNAAPNYQIILTYADNSPKIINVGNTLSKTFESVELNGILLGLNLNPDEVSQVSIEVKAILSATSEIVSNTVPLTATAYPDKLNLSTIWGVVGSATTNGWNGPDMPFYITSDPNVIVAYVTLTDGEIKFRTNNAWDLNYGDNGADGTLEQDGANIAVTAGTYKISFNTNTLTYTIEPYTWGLVGSATPNGWNGPDVKLNYDPDYDDWTTITTLTDGEIKFRLNNAWNGNDWGDANGDNIIDQAANNNIVVTAGTYLVKVNFNTGRYSLTPQ